MHLTSPCDGPRIPFNGVYASLVLGKLGAADDAFLRFRGERIPCVKIVEIFLHDDVAAAGKRGVLFADQHGVGRGRAPGILRPVDETHEIAVVEVTEAVHFVHR